MKLLSIDGGGIKGLYSAAFVSSLEKIYGKQTVDSFDLIAGTSTGGIIALAIAARIPLDEIVNFFKTWGPKIFQRKLKIPKNWVLSKYSNHQFTEALKKMFGDKTIADIYSANHCPALCIASIDVIQGTPIVFKTPHNPALSRDGALYLWEVALATSSAPTLFPIAKIFSRESTNWNLYVDGGLWANNPSLIALTEALTYKQQVMKDVFMLSVGNINTITSFKSNTLLSKGIAQWSVAFIKMTMNAQSMAVHNQVQLLFKAQGLSRHYVRIDQPATGHKSLQQLDCVTQSNLNDLESLGNSRAYSVSSDSSISQFYK